MELPDLLSLVDLWSSVKGLTVARSNWDIDVVTEKLLITRHTRTEI